MVQREEGGEEKVGEEPSVRGLWGEERKCPKCGEAFSDPAAFLAHLEEKHPPPTAEVLARRVEELGKAVEATQKATAEMMGGVAKALEELNKRLERLEKPAEVKMGEEARREEENVATALRIAEEAKARDLPPGWQDPARVGQFLVGLGQLAQGLRGAPAQRENPFEKAGVAMFEAFARVMTETIARRLGKEVGEEVVHE